MRLIWGRRRRTKNSTTIELSHIMDQGDLYNIYESSDEGSYDSDSSDDGFKSFIRETYGIKKECASVARKDFEDEMEQELSDQIKIVENELEQEFNKHIKPDDDVMRDSLHANNHSSLSEPATECNQTDAQADLPTFTEKRKESDASTLRNDDLLYDPEMDDDDQKWIDEQRRSYTYPGVKTDHTQKQKPLPNSDAVLNCPGCLTLLCLDCQRHEVYKSQYRAMFVTNCIIDNTQRLHYPLKKKGSKKSSISTGYKYNPVTCGICNTSVAVYDEDEVYHFFNVVSSFT